ncbi:zinc transporter ZIP1-like [Mizuhopecten yessoensis]|uniref:zinc transporter ZIP1-like n=1 Tax=Mizuhopecten yessoensis TaxID=6573 RepID=UPI000B45BC56|nr:zinc transporter ZIP1-like [Mizuhopecten yessoensis]
MKNLSRLQHFVSLMNCFAGGVFLGTSILHLIQESMETVAEAIPEVDFPLSGVLIEGDILARTDPESIGEINSTFQSDEKKNGELRTEAFCTHGETSFSKDETNAATTQTVTHAIDDTKQKSAVMDISGDGRSKTTKRIRTIILVIALSIHMIFEGMAIGLQDSEVSTWTLMVAISIHKIIVVFSVCLKMREIIESNIQIIIYILYLASVSPVGIAVGLAISSSGSAGSAQEISSGVLQSLAAGTFLYVTFFEILQKELSNGYSLFKVFLTLLGFAVMAGLKVLDKD